MITSKKRFVWSDLWGLEVWYSGNRMLALTLLSFIHNAKHKANATWRSTHSWRLFPRRYSLPCVNLCICVCVSEGHTGVEPRRVARVLVTALVVLGLGCGSGAEYG